MLPSSSRFRRRSLRWRALRDFWPPKCHRGGRINRRHACRTRGCRGSRRLTEIPVTRRGSSVRPIVPWCFLEILCSCWLRRVTPTRSPLRFFPPFCRNSWSLWPAGHLWPELPSTVPRRAMPSAYIAFGFYHWVKLSRYGITPSRVSSPFCFGLFSSASSAGHDEDVVAVETDFFITTKQLI